MKLFPEFTVLIDRRMTRRRLFTAVAALLLAAGSLGGAGLAYGKPPAAGKERKIARELDDGVTAARTPKAKWARDVRGVRQVQVVVVTDGVDPGMADLRAFVLRAGGSVHAAFPSLHALTVQIKASLVQQLAERDDVVSVSPNRELQRTASTLESITGAVASNARTHNSPTSYSGLLGTGIGIAVLDSGVMKLHDTFKSASGRRVQRNVNMLNANLANWTEGVDTATTSLQPGSSALTTYENAVANDSSTTQDAFGHGTHVASVAAGRYYENAKNRDITGVAPNANIYDVKVLDGLGMGTLSDALEGIQWVIFHAKEYNIRVLNVSLAAGSTEAWQTDPLCQAVRSATAAGITVVVAAGNFGQSMFGQEIFGAISAPGNDPSVITVGAVNYKDTVTRGDDVVNNFSSRGPTRSSYVNGSGVRVVDNLLKPDLVAPGNKVVGAAATKSSALTWNFLANSFFSTLVTPLGFSSYTVTETQMLLSGTSVAAPVVAGTVALMLEANPGLTPPLIKAILQYSAQPLPNANLLQQGAGMLNIDGAIALAKALRTDLATAINAGTISAGDALLAAGKAMPAATSTISGSSFNWSRIAFVGGNRVVSGSGLFTKYQPIYDPRITWAGKVVRARAPVYWSGSGITADTYPKYFTDAAAPNQALITSSVVRADSLAGTSSKVGRTGAFIPTATLSGWLVSGSGLIMSEGIILSEGLILSEGVILSEGLILSEGVIMSEGLILSEGIILSEGLILSEGGTSVSSFKFDINGE